MFSISTTLVQVVAILAAVATPSFGALIERACDPTTYYLCVVVELEPDGAQCLSTAKDYLGNYVFELVTMAAAAKITWSGCDPHNVRILVSILFLE